MSFYNFLRTKKTIIYFPKEQKNYASKKILIVLSISSLIFGGYSIFSILGSPDFNIQSLRSENKLLKNELKTMMSNYKELSGKIDSLSKTNNDLRLAVNLHPVSEDELKVGVGGGYFDNTIDFLSNDAESELSKAKSFVDEISRKIQFEKAQALYGSHFRWFWFKSASYSSYQKNA